MAEQQEDGSWKGQVALGSHHSAYDANQADENYRASQASSGSSASPMTDFNKMQKMASGLGVLILVVGPFYYIPQLIQTALRDYGITASFWTVFCIVGLPLIALCAWTLFRFFTKGKGKIILLVLMLILMPCGVLGFIKVIALDLLYAKYVSIQTTRFADGKGIHITAPQASIRAEPSADSKILSNPRKGASMMLVGAGDSGQLLVRYRQDGNKLVWGWIDADKTSYKNSSLTGLVPATILSDTLDLHMYQRPESRKNTTIDNGLNVAVIGKSSSILVGTKKGKSHVPVYAWNNDTSYRYTGYAPIDGLSLQKPLAEK